MIEPDAMNKFWPPLVREVEQTKEYPGYRYKFFQTFEELDAYFTDLCGPDWINQEWARFWIGQHNTTRSAFKRELAVRNGHAQVAYRQYDRREMVARIIKIYRAQSTHTSFRKVRQELNAQGYDLAPATVFKFCKEALQELEKGP